MQGGRAYNPGWHLALDLRNMLLVSESIAKAALARKESRGGHTRDDFPRTADEWGTKNLVVSLERRRHRRRPGREAAAGDARRAEGVLR